MDNYSYIRENYKKTVYSLSAAVKQTNDTSSDLLIDGLIQRFEFCTDFALKSMHEYMDIAGHTVDKSSKDILKKASQIGLIEHMHIWTQLIADRNTTSKIYDKSDAKRISNAVRYDYLTLFQGLAKKFS